MTALGMGIGSVPFARRNGASFFRSQLLAVQACYPLCEEVHLVVAGLVKEAVLFK